MIRSISRARRTGCKDNLEVIILLLSHLWAGSSSVLLAVSFHLFEKPRLHYLNPFGQVEQRSVRLNLL